MLPVTTHYLNADWILVRRGVSVAEPVVGEPVEPSKQPARPCVPSGRFGTPPLMLGEAVC
ncbi:MAG: hypothetical protein LBS86_00240 [Treponema sp.]|nr:hypothetical protein [Treponema sp.]